MYILKLGYFKEKGEKTWSYASDLVFPVGFV